MHFLIDEIVSSAHQRCIEPVSMETSVSNWRISSTTVANDVCLLNASRCFSNPPLTPFPSRPPLGLPLNLPVHLASHLSVNVNPSLFLDLDSRKSPPFSPASPRIPYCQIYAIIDESHDDFLHDSSDDFRSESLSSVRYIEALDLSGESVEFIGNLWRQNKSKSWRFRDDIALDV